MSEMLLRSALGRRRRIWWFSPSGPSHWPASSPPISARVVAVIWLIETPRSLANSRLMITSSVGVVGL